MTRKSRFFLVATTALSVAMSAPAFSQSRSDGAGGVTSLNTPTYDANTSLGSVDGDNLGNHVAAQDLNMDGFAIFNTAAPTDPMDVVNLQHLQDYVSANGDNLGDHMATQVLDMNGFAVRRIPAPTAPDHATNRAYVDTAVAGAGDNLGNHKATENLDLNSMRIVNLSDPVDADDAVNYGYLQTYVDANGDHLGNHTATQNLDMANFKISNLGAPALDGDGANKLYVDGVLVPVQNDIAGLKAIKIIAGTGLSGGGDLTADRTISFDTTWGDARYALRSRAINAGTGLTGGGNLAANRTISLDTAFGDTRWVNNSGNETISGTKTFSGSVLVNTPTANNQAANKGYVDTTLSNAIAGANSTYALRIRKINAGTGLTGGGDLAADRTLSVDGTVFRTSAGISGDLRFNAANGRGVRFWDSDGYKIYMSQTSDSTWGGRLDTTSDYNMYFRMSSGTNRGFVFKNGNTPVFQITATGGLYAANGQVIRDSNGGWVRTYGNTGWYNGTYGGGFYMQDTSWIRAYGNKNILTGGVIRGDNGIQVDGVNMITGSAQLNANSKTIVNVATPTSNTHAANKSYVDSKASYSAGTGLSKSGSTFSFNATWGDGRYALRSRTIATGTGLTGGGNLTANRTISLNSNQQRRAAGQSAQGVMAYNGNSRTSGQFYGGSTNPSHTTRLNYSGSLYATRFYSTAYYYFSDKNLKKDIVTIEADTGMGIVRELRPVSYAWKANDQQALGIIAQEVEEVVPTAVTTNETGTKAVDYVQLIAPMLAAIQGLDGRVKALEGAAH